MKKYVESLVLFPRKGGAKQGIVDDNAEDNLDGLVGEQVTDKGVFALEKPSPKVSAQEPSAGSRVTNAYKKMRLERMNKRLDG